MNQDKKQSNLINLKFSVTGKPVTIEKVNVNQPLKVSVQKALDETGSTRPIDEYEVLFNNNKLDVNQKVESFNFPDDAVIFVSLKTGQGGI
ncbi:MAG: DUF2604 domain-containing protein [Porphyromonadaceae bacterium]|nr:DUF2604 domain-containing protein [Porphyromonadaceae bacterium]